ncbi:hypothetical protein D7Y46_08795 [Stenotrophomonas maltophilia]|nr:hypothetical protein [Stenotrophomonas maltophilia]HBC49757.1 hypothetical protein [Stenotrophomonas maltophilia]
MGDMQREVQGKKPVGHHRVVTEVKVSTRPYIQVQASPVYTILHQQWIWRNQLIGEAEPAGNAQFPGDGVARTLYTAAIVSELPYEQRAERSTRDGAAATPAGCGRQEQAPAAIP